MEFWSPDFVATVLPAQGLSRAQDGVVIPIDTNSDNITDPPKHFIGKHVVIINKNIFKAYQGVIKDIQQDNFAIVELNAGLRRVRVRLSNLAMMYEFLVFYFFV